MAYVGHLVSHSDPEGSRVEIGMFAIVERRGQGWGGYMIPAGGHDSMAEAVETPEWLEAGRAVRLRLSAAGAEGARRRSWVSLVLSVTVMTRLQFLAYWLDDTPSTRDAPTESGLLEGSYGDLDDVVRCITVADPLSFLWDRPIWDVFHDRSVGRILGGAMSLAAGGDGRPSLKPFADLPDLPRVRIREMGLREAARSVQPYVIASGESLGHLLGNLLGMLGIRIEVREGPAEAEIVIELHEHAPSTAAANVVRMALEDGGEVREDNALVERIGVVGLGEDNRSGVLDLIESERSRLDQTLGVVDTVLSVDLPAGEATARMHFARDASPPHPTTTLVQVDTRNAGLLPGRVVRFTNQTIEQTDSWQVASVTHMYTPGGYYRNRATLERAEVVWRTPLPPVREPVVVSAVVSRAGTLPAETIERDEYGRIPVTCIFSRAAEWLVVNASAPDSTPIGSEVESIDLPVIEPLAGRHHGFLPAHRQGDYCRVLVHDPFHAEVLGFAYDETRRVSKGYRHDEARHGEGYTSEREVVTSYTDPEGVSGGIIVYHGGGQWSGLVFTSEDDDST